MSWSLAAMLVSVCMLAAGVVKVLPNYCVGYESLRHLWEWCLGPASSSVTRVWEDGCQYLTTLTASGEDPMSVRGVISWEHVLGFVTFDNLLLYVSWEFYFLVVEFIEGQRLEATSWIKVICHRSCFRGKARRLRNIFRAYLILRTIIETGFYIGFRPYSTV